MFPLYSCRCAVCRGMEQYYYTHTGGTAAYVPMAHYNTSNNWYGEARYNYDEFETFSLYAGKKFSKRRQPVIFGNSHAGRINRKNEWCLCWNEYGSRVSEIIFHLPIAVQFSFLKIR